MHYKPTYGIVRTEAFYEKVNYTNYCTVFFSFFPLSCKTTKELYDNREGAGRVRENYGKLENEERGVTEDIIKSAISTNEAKEQAEAEGSLIERLKKLIRQIRERDSEQNKHSSFAK